MDIIDKHNKLAKKLEELDEKKRELNKELSEMSEELIAYVKEKTLGEQVEIMDKMLDSQVTYDLYFTLKELYEKPKEVVKDGGL